VRGSNNVSPFTWDGSKHCSAPHQLFHPNPVWLSSGVWLWKAVHTSPSLTWSRMVNLPCSAGGQRDGRKPRTTLGSRKREASPQAPLPKSPITPFAFPHACCAQKGDCSENKFLSRPVGETCAWNPIPPT